MRIQNNITALNAHRQYGINNANISKSVEKLSSGYRINRAGDDAAGLAISEKMRAQIKGLNMASKNSQDAISLVQTAEGALQESHNILQRMRELAVQSASDTNETSIDRGALQKEFAELIKELDDTAAKTKFNDMGLIDGSFASNKTTATAAGAKLGLAWASESHANGDQFKIRFDSVEVVKATTGAATSATYSGALSGAATGGTLTISWKNTGAVESSKFNGNWTLSVEQDGDVFKLIAKNDSNGEVMSRAIGGVEAFSSAAVTDKMSVSIDMGALGTFTISSTGTVKASDFQALEGNIKVSGGIDQTNAKYEYIAILEKVGTNDSKTVVDEAVVQTGQSTLNFKNAGVSVQLQDVVSVNKTPVDVKDSAGTVTQTAVDQAADIVKSLSTNFAGQIDITKNSGKDLVIQTGANQGDSLSINLGNMNSYSLGIAASSINNRANAQVAITQVNTALNIVSTQRAALGALQNRLDHKIANLDTSAENLSAAESRIRDVDMAKQMTEFTKQNILSQASTAMLAQANALPQGVLQLLG